MKPRPALSRRPYPGPQALDSLVCLIQKVRPPEWRNDHPTRVDLHELLQSPAVRDRTRLWFMGDDLAAFALVDDYNNLVFECPHSLLDLLGSEIVQWGMDCSKTTHALTLDTSSRESNRTRILFLEKHGFRKTAVETICMERDLDRPIPQTVLPEGFDIRSVQGEGDATRLAELHRAAFGSENVTTETRLSWMRVPGFDPSLDLIVLVPDGSFAANCMCSVTSEEKRSPEKLKGHTDPIMTHPRFQRRGLARALLLVGLNLLKQRGVGTAILSTTSDNLPMQKAARSAGFSIRSRKFWFEKPLQ